MENNCFGFQELLQNLRDYTAPQIVFEATGVYSQRLQRFLDDHQYRYTCLNSLAVRSNKTDQNDALHLAQTQLVINRQLSYYQRPIYHDLMAYSRFYEELNDDLIREKNFYTAVYN
ncbi:transposase [Lactobacillus sp. DCY120]|uniref:Transposase n=1 Tax=Bombilactobacillus apium TaxID=2675299 RepID=A0A850R7F7_9LACO|nr:transposase [Bombilactobacillus apium]NVY96777.1 transposase [Bombilactobacillus apium]